MIIPKGEQEWEFGKESGRICGCKQDVKLERKRRGRVVGGMCQEERKDDIGE